jgi:hypothetical protein
MTDQTQETTVPTAEAPRKRKERSDKGKKRGPRKPKAAAESN